MSKFCFLIKLQQAWGQIFDQNGCPCKQKLTIVNSWVSVLNILLVSLIDMIKEKKVKTKILFVEVYTPKCNT